MGQDNSIRAGGKQSNGLVAMTNSSGTISRQEVETKTVSVANPPGVELTINKPSPEELNKGIVQARQDYTMAQMRNDQKGMAVALQTANNLRALGGTSPFLSGVEDQQVGRMIVESPADRGTTWRDPIDGSVIITSGEDKGEVVISPTRPNVELQNSIVANAKVKYFRAQLFGDTRTMNEAVKEGELARARGATLRADEDTPLTRSLKRYVNQVDVVKTAIRTRNTADLNKGIVQMKNDYLYAKSTNDPVGMEASTIMGDILRRLGGTIGPNISLEDAKKMIQPKTVPQTPASAPSPIDTSPKKEAIFDRVLGFVTGAGAASGESLLSMVQANSDPLGTALGAIHKFVSALPEAYQAAVDWEQTLDEIDTLLTQFHEYYQKAPAYEKGKLEGEILINTLFGIFAGRKVTIVNGKLATGFHPVSGVPFDSAGFPIFDSKFEARIEPVLYTASQSTHFDNANKQLLEAIRKDASIASHFTEEDVSRLEEGLNPIGYTWHHHQEPGRLQLVDKVLHQKTGHTGGMAIWGK